MKLSRKTLLIITGSLGLFMILYGVFRYFTGIGFGERVEKYMFDIIIFAALGLFVYNRSLVKKEKDAIAAKEEAALRAAEEAAEREEEAAASRGENSAHDENPSQDENSLQ